MTTSELTFDLNYNLARFHRVSRRYREAIQLHGMALASRRQKLGVDHVDTLRSQSSLANAFYAAGYYQQARQMFQDTL